MTAVKLQNYPLQQYDAEEEVEADRLSFSNLPMGGNDSGSLQQSPRAYSPQIDQFFEFFSSQSRPVYSNPDIIFCGKIIHEEEELNEYQKRDYFATLRSRSCRKPSMTDRRESRGAENRFISTEKSRYSSSTRYSTDPIHHVQRVNITALTSMSAKSRRRMFLSGPVKFKPEMELSAIKQRQARRVPEAKAVVSGGGKREGGTGRLWSLVRSGLLGRSQLTSVLARSFGCFPVGSGVERLIGVTD